jgi:hypothetical protein
MRRGMLPFYHNMSRQRIKRAVSSGLRVGEPLAACAGGSPRQPRSEVRLRLLLLQTLSVPLRQ